MSKHSSSNRSSPGRARPRGFTIVEVMIASTLMLLIMGGVLQLMVAGNSYLSLQESKAELQKDMTLAFLWMSREMRETDADSVETSPTGVTFVSPRDLEERVVFDSVGRLLWQKNVCYYVGSVDGQSSLIRKVKALPTPANSPPPAASVDSLRLDNSIPAEVKARHMKSITFDATMSPMQVTVMGEIKSSRGRKYGMELKTRVYFRN